MPFLTHTRLKVGAAVEFRGELAQQGAVRPVNLYSLRIHLAARDGDHQGGGPIDLVGDLSRLFRRHA